MTQPRFKVVITDFITGVAQPELDVLGDLATVEPLDARAEDDLAGRVDDAHAVLIYGTLPFWSRSVQRLRCCRVIVRGGVGYDNIDLAAARQRGIPVVNVPDYGTEEVADTTLGLILTLTRGISFINSRLRAGAAPWRFSEAGPLHRLRDRVLGIVGLGAIGMAVATRAKSLGMEVAFFDPYLPDGYGPALGLRRAESLDELLASARVLTLHCRLTTETRGLIGRAAIGRMPRGSYLVNTARGPLVDTAAVAEMVASGQLAGAALDVFEQEPPPENDPLLVAWRDPRHPAHHRVLLTPHTAFYSEESLLDRRIKSAQAARRALLGQPLRNIVNR